ncbi:MAG: UDP-N-acetylmuramate dehydrogenase [Pseudomonadota bacterium]|nr:UDP-N-acetylmuramate dehydrogenase [Pseudomonadota bacterium]
MLANANPRLMRHLPPVRGEVYANLPLRGNTWFRTGGPAEFVFKPADMEDLRTFRSKLDPEIDVTLLGHGSNVLIRDGGILGVVIHLSKTLNDIVIEKNEVIAGAGASSVTVARACHRRSLGGLEFLSGIPGTIGGALSMNAGAYGHEISDVLLSAIALDPKGILHDLSSSELQFSYRSTALQENWIFLSARLRCTSTDPDEISRKMTKISKDRKTSQPAHLRTGGSTFKNTTAGKAWKLIDAAGCRGLAVGDAMVSEKHCNFLINRGNATAHDLESLGNEVRRRVLDHSGIALEWEIRRIGVSSIETAP